MAASKATQAARDVLERNRAHAMGFAQQAGQARLRELLTDAAKDLAKRLQQAEGLKNADGSATFTAVQRRATLAQVQQVLRKLKGGLQDAVVEHGVEAAQGGAAGVAKYLTAADNAYRGVGVSPLALDEAAMLEAASDGARGSILRRLAGDPDSGAQKGILERYGLETVNHFEKQLQVGFVAKKSWAEMRDDLTSKSPFLQAAPRYWAERIVRTEVAGAHNRGLWESIRRADDDLGDMVKILSAVFDDRTASDSYAVHGQIRRPDEPFESWYGLYMHPPNRPNDREVVVAHRIAWPIPPYLAWVDDEKVAKVWEAEGHKQAMPERPEMTTVPLDDFGRPPEEEATPEGEEVEEQQGEVPEEEKETVQEQVPEDLEPEEPEPATAVGRLKARGHWFSDTVDTTPEFEEVAAEFVEKGGYGPLLKDSPIALSIDDLSAVMKDTAGVCWGERHKGHPNYPGRPEMAVDTQYADGSLDSEELYEPKKLGPKTYGVALIAKSPREVVHAIGIHELGHHLHLGSGLGLELDVEIGDLYTQRIDSEKRVRKGQWVCSKYACANHREWFAETHTAYVMAGDDLKAKDPEAYDLMERVREDRGLAKRGRAP